MACQVHLALKFAFICLNIILWNFRFKLFNCDMYDPVHDESHYSILSCTHQLHSFFITCTILKAFSPWHPYFCIFFLLFPLGYLQVECKFLESVWLSRTLWWSTWFSPTATVWPFSQCIAACDLCEIKCIFGIPFLLNMISVWCSKKMYRQINNSTHISN